MKTAVIRKVKLDRGYGRWPAYEIADDDHGRWFFSPKGTVYRGHPADGKIVDWEVGRPRHEAEGMAELWLLPHAEWWVANWYEYRGVRRIAVDVCTPPQLVEGEWRFVDLELDPHWDEDGAVGIRDEDEFTVACEKGLIAAEKAELARATADRVLELLRGRVEPFGSDGWARFDESLMSGVMPIESLAPTSTA